MDRNEVQSIVLATIAELRRQGMLRDEYEAIRKTSEPLIRQFFLKKNNEKIKKFLIEYSDDPYIDIIYLHYRDNATLEKIAEWMEKDVSTVKRNKKRLLMLLYDFLEV